MHRYLWSQFQIKLLTSVFWLYVNATTPSTVGERWLIQWDGSPICSLSNIGLRMFRVFRRHLEHNDWPCFSGTFPFYFFYMVCYPSVKIIEWVNAGAKITKKDLVANTYCEYAFHTKEWSTAYLYFVFFWLYYFKRWWLSNTWTSIFLIEVIWKVLAPFSCTIPPHGTIQELTSPNLAFAVWSKLSCRTFKWVPAGFKFCGV